MTPAGNATTGLFGALVLRGLAWGILAVADPPTVTVAIVAGALSAAASAAFLAAAGRPLHRRAGQPGGGAWHGADSAVFVLGLFFYFVAVTAAADTSVDAAFRQLFYMLIALDLYATGKLVYFAGVTRAPRWRMFYSLLVLTMIGVALNDVIACLRVAGVMPRSGALYGLGWSVPLLFLVLAARLRHQPVPSGESVSESRRDEESAHREEEPRDDQAARRNPDEKLIKAWRSIPDPMVVSTVADGRILEVNDSFLRHFGYARDEVLGKTGVELKLWVEPEDRAMMTCLLRERGAVRNLAFELTHRSGEKRLTLLSGEIVDLEGSTCFVMVLRDVTELKSLEFTAQ